MNKRIVAAGLWFVSASALGGFAEVFFGVSADLGSYLGIVLAALAILDPTRHFWGPRHRAASHLATAQQSS